MYLFYAVIILEILKLPIKLIIKHQKIINWNKFLEFLDIHLTKMQLIIAFGRNDRNCKNEIKNK